jgi:hypothetical protein
MVELFSWTLALAVDDPTPAWLKDFAIRTFGDDDKLVLLALFALALGLLALRQRPAASAGVLLFGVVGAAAAVGRPNVGGPGVLPALVGTLAGAAPLYLLTGRLALTRTRTAGGGAPEDESEPGTSDDRTSFDRRGFVLAATGTAAATAGAGLLARALTASGTARAAAFRDSVVLPAPASKAPPVPPGAAPDGSPTGPPPPPAAKAWQSTAARRWPTGALPIPACSAWN